MNYVYLLQEREFVRLNEHTYKIGRTSRGPHSRFKQYPKDSKLLFLQNVTDSKQIEHTIKKVFKHKYKHMTQYGAEYFNGNFHDMINDIQAIIRNQEQNQTKTISPTDKLSVIQFMTEFTHQCTEKNIIISTLVLYKHYKSYIHKKTHLHIHPVDIEAFEQVLESLLKRVIDLTWEFNVNQVKLRIIETQNNPNIFTDLEKEYKDTIYRFKDYIHEHVIPHNHEQLHSLYKLWKSPTDPHFYKPYFNKITKTRSCTSFII